MRTAPSRVVSSAGLVASTWRPSSVGHDGNGFQWRSYLGAEPTGGPTDVIPGADTGSPGGMAPQPGHQPVDVWLSISADAPTPEAIAEVAFPDGPDGGSVWPERTPPSLQLACSGASWGNVMECAAAHPWWTVLAAVGAVLVLGGHGGRR